MPPKKKSAAAAAPAPAPIEEDVPMGDAPTTTEDADVNEDEGEESVGNDDDDAVSVFEEEQRIRILPGSSDTAASFEFMKEDHTLGNSLRYIIMKNPDVEFCGYSIPHPSEALMNIRIQTYEGTTAVEALEKGLTDLMDLCDAVADKFCKAREEYTATPKA
ncbi:DNA-directed RNA polymerase [Rhexocercosporidium sp. MPI-PUGE-AT-0058]|nr:DNA-directed RNA polymerase [Rhexocercosporidium sp. MPI-PUGE-AT-0058]